MTWPWQPLPAAASPTPPTDAADEAGISAFAISDAPISGSMVVAPAAEDIRNSSFFLVF